MSREDKINVELFFNLIELKNNLEEVLDNCDTQLEIIKQFPENFKNKQKLIQEELEKTLKEIEISNKEISNILNEISVTGLDEIIKKSERKNINYLLDIRSKKSQ